MTLLIKRSQIDFEIDFLEGILSRDPNYVEVLINLGELLSRKGRHRRALQVDQRLAQLRPNDPVVLYNLACSCAVLNHIPAAIEALRRAIQSGYCDLDFMAVDPDLTSIRMHPEYIRMVQALELAVARIV